MSDDVVKGRDIEQAVDRLLDIYRLELASRCREIYNSLTESERLSLLLQGTHESVGLEARRARAAKVLVLAASGGREEGIGWDLFGHESARTDMRAVKRLADRRGV